MRALLPAIVLLIALAACTPAPSYNVEERSIAQLQADLESGAVTSEQLVEAYLARIAAMDDAGPSLNAIIALNPNALEDARALDAERRGGRVRGPLHGIPILLKDNIETRDMATTAGSLALADNNTGRDAPLVQRLRDAGAIILGKTNLSEWANIRSSYSVSGWSAIGGLTRNPYALDRNACGSSSGTGASIAASFAAIGVGTETDGSIVCPSSINGLVGLKPTLGLISRTHVVPISHSQDTPGPMGRTVADVAALMDAMVGSDGADAATVEADLRRTDYSAALDANALQGRRIGVARFMAGFHPGVDTRFAAALAHLREAGAELVDITEPPPELDQIGEDEFVVLLTELRADLNAYLATTPQNVRTRTLGDVIAFNRETPEETALFGQDVFETADATSGLDDPAYLAALARSQSSARAALDGMLARFGIEALVAPTLGPAWTTDLINGDHYIGGGASMLPAVSGYPHLTVPMGQISGLPIGLSFIGPAWSDAQLLAFGYAFEQRANARLAPTYARTVVDAAPFADAMRGANRR